MEHVWIIIQYDHIENTSFISSVWGDREKAKAKLAQLRKEAGDFQTTYECMRWHVQGIEGNECE